MHQQFPLQLYYDITITKLYTSMYTLTLKSWIEVANVQRSKKKFIGSTEDEQDRIRIIQPHDGIGRKVGNLV